MKITLYEFSRLPDQEQYDLVFNKGTFIDSIFKEGKRFALYAVDMFFVEIEYHPEQNRIIRKKAFIAGATLNKYVNLKL